MTGRQLNPEPENEDGTLVRSHDLCPCGRRDPRTFSPEELAKDAKAYRRVQRAAARLRLVTDRQLDLEPTPEWVVTLAGEEGDPILGSGRVEKAIARLDREARKHCSCRCHGSKTQGELDDAARQDRNVRRAGARLQKVLDEMVERHTPESVPDLAAEDDE